MVWLALLSGCVGTVGSSEPKATGGEVDPDDPDRAAPYTLTVDTSATDPFAPAHATTWNVSGTVTASEGLGQLMVAGGAVPTGADGRFTREVSVTPGLNLVEIVAQDMAMPAHARQAHRTILASDYLPEGHINPQAAALTLTNEVLAPMAEPLAGRVASLDIASEIMARGTLTDDTCTTYPDSASHGPPALEIQVDDMGALWLVVTIPSLQVRFHGSCSTFIFSTDIRGSMSTHVVMRAQLSAPPGDVCITGLEHEPPIVDLVDFDMDVSGGSGLFESLLISLMGEMREGDTADAMKAEFAAQTDELLGSELMGISVFDASETMSLFDTPIDVRLCLTGLVTEGGTLRARVGATASGPGGTLEAPGAPVVQGELPAAAPGKLWLDANLVGQLLFSAWRAGAMSDDSGEQIDIGTLGLVVPALRGRYPAGTMANIAIDGRLPPMVRAAVPEEGDLALDIGELYVLISVDGELLFRIGTNLRMTLELVPEGDALRPEVAALEHDIWVAEEPVLDADDDALASAVGLQIGDAAAGLLGDTAIALPDIGGAMVPADVVATPGGRYLEITLE